MKRFLLIPYRKELILTLFSFLICLSSFAQTKIIRGVITDEKNEPLPGAVVKAQSGSGSAGTDANGTFSVTVPQNEQVLVASYIGFTSQEIRINGRTTINIKLVSDNKVLDEVVVVGYGVQRAEAVTGSVASIRGEALRDVPSANISQALQGRLPGVDLSQTSSQPGAAMQIRIRGTRSLSANNDPLVVLDGIPFAGLIGDISPSDIKSIEILKDASATAIYGSRGANGVILVTTNRGQLGQKATINYSNFVGKKDVFGRYPMMNGPELIALRAAANQFKNNPIDESDDVNTDWQDLLYRTGSIMSHDLGVSGGSEQGSYNFNAGYLEDKGVIPTQQYKRYSIRGTVDQNIGEYFRLGFTTNSNFNVTGGSNIGMYGVLQMSPLANPYNADGSWKRVINMPLDQSWSYSKDVINDLSDTWLNRTEAYGTYNTLYAEVKIPGVEGLKYRANVGLNYRQSNNGSFTGAGITSATDARTPSTASISNRHILDYTIENLLTYDRTFADKHQVNFVGLYSVSQNRENVSQVGARNIPNEDFQFYNLGQATGEITINPANQNYTLSGLMSYMGRIMYSYDNRYMLSATMRSDGSSRLAPGHKWHTYPAVSVGWNISKESFMENITAINMLKLRVGYGQTSNQSINPYATLGRLNTRPYNFGTATAGNLTGFYVDQLPNPNLGWEYSSTLNYGLDFALLNNRLTGTVEYYETKTKDILLGLGLPQTSGVDSYTANIGTTQNKGIELSLNGVILDNANGWTWEAGVNFYGNRNKLTNLASGQPDDKTNWWFVGKPIDVIYDYEKTGLWQEGDPYLNILEPGGNVGMIKVKYTGGYNADGTPTRAVGPDDRQVIDIQPKFQGGLNTRVAYKGFDLTVIGAFKKGGILNSTLYSSSGYLNMLSGRRGNVRVDYWTPENTDANYPKPGGIVSNDNPKYGSTLGYFDASYLKIRTISLGYNFNADLLKKAGIGRLRVYATAQNPFVFFSPYNKESGMDPETNSYGNEGTATAVPYVRELRRLLTLGTNAPATRNYLLGVNLTF
ncbi:SusC/RagA family TonB-linked outer membrane protein [Arcticibacter eurypsychrophilus]|uniref:SusC/RagA family TonB-linked outer membrane protein n=1 Tax=Arcticibacter eurypsychrophilus TaxID=1434752 RepID=UPI00084DEA62|nr:TonB-dependent receptor [Arcticibacter eurypsychrophilus]